MQKVVDDLQALSGKTAGWHESDPRITGTESNWIVDRPNPVAGKLYAITRTKSLPWLRWNAAPQARDFIYIRALTAHQLEHLFSQLAESWKGETGHWSSAADRAMHPAYQQIIGLGPAVVPLILRELTERPDHWFWALNAITREDPASDAETIRGAVEAWIAWGRQNKYIVDLVDGVSFEIKPQPKLGHEEAVLRGYLR